MSGLTYRIRVLVVEDNPVVQILVRAMLDSAMDVEVVAVVDDGRKAVAEAESLKPDVILMDLVMPVMDGIEASRRILSRQRRARILAFTSLRADSRVQAAIRAGVRGYLHKTASKQELLQAIREVHGGEQVFPIGLRAEQPFHGHGHQR